MLPQGSLCLAHAESFWPWRRWTELAAWKDREQTLVVLPICGFSEPHPEAPLDSEERLLTDLLAHALEDVAPDSALMLPPVRFVTGPSDTCVFTVAPELAHAQLEEICLSVKDAGFRRIVFVNSSRWNEELCDVAARDLRVDHALQLFCIHLRALGIAELAPDDSVVAANASTALRRLLVEIQARPPLARSGAFVPRELP
ncbi:hypothetical protein DB347_09770 [Opitutaceae bacterium EW11]|nr:hypothetical protein DB347_09770 [Opitutaceae bacterium EW11]